LGVFNCLQTTKQEGNNVLGMGKAPTLSSLVRWG